MITARAAELKRYNKIGSHDATLRAICRGPDCFIGTDDDTACGLSFIHMHVNEREHTVVTYYRLLSNVYTCIVKRASTADYHRKESTQYIVLQTSDYM